MSMCLCDLVEIESKQFFRGEISVGILLGILESLERTTRERNRLEADYGFIVGLLTFSKSTFDFAFQSASSFFCPDSGAPR